ncbi:hypothetical protein VB690_18235, partial [Nodularia spumigena CH309]|uniref:Uncharacterized protein n=1 Tax=Nodularia spumigena UHCC 0060 TaxID=3110300 RepID=A0ABU5UUT1_NODSP|nr:hypothetical protein [Nodularia spumigena]MEA5558352.1 hypothetical protein [Nodularia spumigena CH309]MEA5610051.1 hypothetical protein [Nodularia spumigena UHCC 0060]
MKIFPSLKKIVVYSLVLLVSVCSLLFTAPTAIAAVDGSTQYIAFDRKTRRKPLTLGMGRRR